MYFSSGDFSQALDMQIYFYITVIALMHKTVITIYICDYKIYNTPYTCAYNVEFSFTINIFPCCVIVFIVILRLSNSLSY